MPELSQAPRIARMPWVSGNRYDGTSSFGGTVATQAMSANLLIAVPIIPVHPSLAYGVPIALDRIGLEVTTAGTAGKKARLGLATMGSDGKPGALIVDAGEIAVDATGFVELTIAVSVPSGVPIFRLYVSDAAPTVRGEAAFGFVAGLSTTTDISVRQGWSQALAYTTGTTTLPATMAATGITGNAPRIVLRAA